MTTTLSGHFFTLSDFEKLAANRSSFALDESVLNTISYLNTHIEIPDFPAYTPRSEPVRSTASYANKEKDSYHFSRSNKGGSSSRNKRDNNPPPSAEDWELMRSFKTTKMETKTGVDKTINDIRVHLNKMSTANYAKQRDTIMTEIRKYVDVDATTDINTEDIAKIASTIFEIASGNKFFSELYAELYRELVSQFSVFSDILERFVANFPETIRTIEYVDADVDYDGFCRVTKANDKRKATTTFIVNVMKKGLVSPEKVLSILDGFMDTAIQYMGESNRIHQIEEIAENIFLLVSLCASEFREYSQWKKCVDAIVSITNKTNSQTSMSNRVLFKFMDMVPFTK